MIILSILCPTTPDRSEMFSKLFSEVMTQVLLVHHLHPSLGKIEVLVDDSKRFLEGGLSIGKKRESLLRRAEGRYVVFLDSDDDIAPNYVEQLVRLCQHNTDVVTFRNLTKTDTYWTLVDMSLAYHHNDEASPKYITRRKPWHICPIRSLFAKMYDFEDTNYGEDATWMEKVLKHCVTEIHTDQILHQYTHSSKTSEADKIIKKGYV
jgi:hypothetical protein